MFLGTLGKVVAYMLLLALVISIVTVAAIAFLQPQGVAESHESSSPFTAVTTGVRSMMGRFRGGQQLGRAVPGVDPPTVAERLATLSTLAAAQSIVTPSQEVIMTGAPSSAHGCLGGDDEMLIEVINDIGADQLDLSYALNPNDIQPVQTIKVASCTNNSVIKQCIPKPQDDHHPRHLYALAYYYEKVGDVSNIREETRRYLYSFEQAAENQKINASDFMVEGAA